MLYGWTSNNKLSSRHEHNDDQRECAKAHTSKSLFVWIKKTAGYLDEKE
jgi:hypothetical protein